MEPVTIKISKRLRKAALLCLCFILTAAVLGGCGAGGGTPSPSEPSQTKVAAVYLITAADGGFCETLHKTLTELATRPEYKYEYAENVTPADVERFLRGYAERGYNVIFAHTTAYKTAVDKVAPDYPKTIFALFAGQVSAPNGLLYDWLGNESCYLLGVLAGLTTKSNRIGHVGGMKVPNQVRYLGGFEAGVKAVNPQAQIISAFTGSFSDASAGKEVATGQIDQGCDVIFDTMGLAWIGVKDLAKEKDVHIIADYGYKTANAPEVVIAGQMVHYDRLLATILEDQKNGTLKREYWGSLANGICDIMYSSQAKEIIPQEVLDKVEQARKAIVSGQIKVPRKDLEASGS